MARLVLRVRRFLIHNILHADDTPHRIALGVAIAMFVAFLPIVGIQTAVAIGLAALLRANKTVCVPIVWITNPATIAPIYGGCIMLGRALTAAPAGGDAEEVLTALEKNLPESHFWQAAFWQELFDYLLSVSADLWVGCAVVGIVFAVSSYFLGRWGVVRYREQRRQRILRRSLFRAQLQASKVSRRADVS